VIDAHTSDLQVLEALVVNNPDLERLEALLEQFNIFEALGMVRQELRHSDFLAFLCNPSAPHGVGDSEIALLCQRLYARHRRAFDLINKQIEARTERRRRLIDQLTHQGLQPSRLVRPPTLSWSRRFAATGPIS